MTMVDARSAQRPKRPIEKHHRGECRVQSLKFDGEGYTCQGCAAYFGANPPTGRIELRHRPACFGEVDKQDQLCPTCGQRISVLTDPGVPVERPHSADAPTAASEAPLDRHKVADVWTTEGRTERRVEVARSRYVEIRAGHGRLTTAAEVIFFMAQPGFRVDIDAAHLDWVADWANQAGVLKADVRVGGARLEGEPGAYGLVRELSPNEAERDGEPVASDAPVWTPPPLEERQRPREKASSRRTRGAAHG